MFLVRCNRVEKMNQLLSSVRLCFHEIKLGNNIIIVHQAVQIRFIVGSSKSWETGDALYKTKSASLVPLMPNPCPKVGAYPNYLQRGAVVGTSCCGPLQDHKGSKAPLPSILQRKASEKNSWLLQTLPESWCAVFLYTFLFVSSFGPASLSESERSCSA